MRAEVRRPDGARISYYSTGEGPPVLAVHGIGSSAQSFGPLSAYLGDTHRVLAVDLRGYGDSSDDPAAGEWSTLAADLAAVLDHAGVGVPAHLVAASAGTLTALTFCHAYAGRVHSLTLLAPTLGDATDPAAAAAQLAQRLTALEQVQEGAAARAARLAGPDADEEAVRLLRRQHARIREAGYGRVARLLARTDAGVMLRRLPVPLQIVVGDHDTVTGPPVAERAHRLLPTADVVTLPRVGHSPHVEQPARTADLVRSFTRRP